MKKLYRLHTAILQKLMSKNNPFLGYLSYKYVTEVTKIGLFVLIHYYSAGPMNNLLGLHTYT